jgi:hypothetical protein
MEHILVGGDAHRFKFELGFFARQIKTLHDIEEQKMILGATANAPNF